MRALFYCFVETDHDAEILLGFEQLHWVSPLPQQSDKIVQVTRELLASIPESERELVASTTVGILHHADTNTWGIVNRASARRIAVRLNNLDAHKLKDACLNLIEKLSNETDSRDESQIRLDTSQPISIREFGSNLPVFQGFVQESSLFASLLDDRKTERITANWAMVAAIALWLLASPWWENIGLSTISHEWLKWFMSACERVSTACLTTALLFYLDLGIRRRHLQEETSIHWSS